MISSSTLSVCDSEVSPDGKVVAATCKVFCIAFVLSIPIISSLLWRRPKLCSIQQQ